MVDFLGGCLGGCFSSRTSCTVCVLVGSLGLAMEFRGRGPLPFACVTSCRAARTLPFIMTEDVHLTHALSPLLTTHPFAHMFNDH